MNIFSANPRLIIGFFFSVYLVIGLCILRDYGVNWDDNDQRVNGLNNWAYLFEHNKEPLGHSMDKYHGPAFELVLIGLEKVAHLKTFREIYLGRHLANFLFFFSSTVAFFFLNKKLFQSSWLALLGCVLLIISPRIFAEAFYNPKDITFLSAVIFASLTLYHFCEKPNWQFALLHGFTCAFACDIRVIGLIIPAATIVIIGIKLLQKKTETRKGLFGTIAFIASLSLFGLFLWPILLEGPGHQLTEAFLQMSKYPWYGSNLYFGKDYSATDTPWHYQPVWMLITTPVFITALFAAGIFFLLKTVVQSPISYFGEHLYKGTFLAFLIIPIFAMAYMHSTVLDGWRHVYFVYPFFVIIAIEGFKRIWALLSETMRKSFLAFTILGILFNITVIIKTHPFQNVYFNPIAQLSAPLNKKFDMDYWGLSYKQGLERISEKVEKGKVVRVAFKNYPGELNYEFLPYDVKQKFSKVEQTDSFDYYLTNNRWESIPMKLKLVDEIKVQKNPILSIYTSK